MGLGDEMLEGMITDLQVKNTELTKRLSFLQETIDLGLDRLRTFEAENAKLQARCEELAKSPVDAGALHLADEQTIRNMNLQNRVLETHLRDLIAVVKPHHIWASTGARVSDHETCETCAILERGLQKPKDECAHSIVVRGGDKVCQHCGYYPHVAQKRKPEPQKIIHCGLKVCIEENGCRCTCQDCEAINNF